MLHQTRTEDSELTTALGMPSLLCLQRHNQWHPVITYLRFSSEVIKAWITLLPFVTFLKLNAFNYLLAAQHELPPLSSSPAAPPHRRDRGILTGEPTSARADSPVRESSPGALGTVGWHLLFSSSTDLERCCLLHMVARCQVPSWCTPKPTFALSCTHKTTQLSETKGAMPVYTSWGYNLLFLFLKYEVERSSFLTMHGHQHELIVPLTIHWFFSPVPFVCCLFLPMHQGASALAGMLIGTVNGWGRTVMECKSVIIHLIVSSLEKWLSIMTTCR